MLFKIKAFHNIEKKWIDSFIVSNNGRIYRCSELGDDINIDDHLSKSTYNDDLIFEDITEHTTLVIEGTIHTNG
jgi:hypothetical protein